MERISIESEQDKAIGTLGETLGTCWFRIHTGMCKAEQCAACPTKQKLDSCYAYLDDFNKLAVENEALKHSARLVIQNGGVKECGRQARFGEAGAYWWTVFTLLLRAAFMLFVIFILPFLLFGCTSVSIPTKEECIEQIRLEVEPCLKMVHENIRDVNGDGLTNCVDHSVVFKEAYDRLYPYHKYNCGFVWNNNKAAGFNHMYVYVYYGWKLVFVEPQAKDWESSDMQKFWGERYNCMYGTIDFWKFKWVLDKCEWEGKDEYYAYKRWVRL